MIAHPAKPNNVTKSLTKGTIQSLRKFFFGGSGAAIGGIGGFFIGGPAGAKIGCSSGLSTGLLIYSATLPDPREKEQILRDKIEKIATNTVVLFGAFVALKGFLNTNYEVVENFNKLCPRGVLQNLPCFLWSNQAVFFTALTCAMAWQFSHKFNATLELLHGT